MPNLVTRIMIFKEGLHIYGSTLQQLDRLTKLQRMVGLCNDVHMRMQEGEEIPEKRKRAELRVS